MAAGPRIEVSADPEALQKAMDALTAYKAAKDAYDDVETKAAEKRDKAITDARAAYGKALGTAQNKLIEAEKEAKKAGVKFPSASSSSKSTGVTRTRLTLEQVKDKLPADEFTTNELAAALGCSTPKAREFISTLLEDHTITEKGSRPNPSGKGRASSVYAKA
jgi:Fic family protein